jgi:signal transduction histidine kinase
MLSRHYLPKDYHFARQISSDSQLITMLSKNKRPMLAESAGYSNLPLETLIVPFFSESELFGFLVLGQKSSKMMYSDSDFVTFDILSSQVSLALENAKHLQELKYSQLELLRQENLKFVSVLVKGLAHEILNPLTPLMHRIEDLEGESLLKLYEVYEKNAQQLGEEESLKFKESLLGLRDSTKSLKNNAQHIHLIVDMLNKMQKGDETTIGPLDLKSFFKDVVPTLALEVEPHLQEGITVNQDIANNIPPIRGNPTLLKQIFINLYKNSCEAMRNSAIKTINISCKLNAQNPKETLIEFSDTGPGIPSVIFSKIFTHGFTTKGTKGSGIGLSQCKAIIEKFGGTINIESKQNQGTKFIIKLPIWTEGKNVS